MGGEIDAFRKLQPIQMLLRSPSMPYLTPDYGGFNYRSLANSRKAPVFRSKENSIDVATPMWEAFQKDSKGKDRDKFDKWRIEK